MSELTQNDYELLAAYKEEIFGAGWKSSLTIEQLISSHKTLRNIVNQERKVNMEEMERYRVIGETMGREMVTNGEYIEVSKLKQMTVADLVNFLAD